MRSLFTTALCLWISSIGFAQNYWKPIEESAIRTQTNATRYIIPQQYQVFHLDLNALKAILALAPMEGKTSNLAVAFPMPDGTTQTFRAWNSPMMEEGLAKKYPQIRTYAAQGRGTTARLDISPNGFHAMIFTEAGTVFIDPYRSNDTENYIVYYRQDYINKTKKFECHVGENSDNHPTDDSGSVAEEAATFRGDHFGEAIRLRKYRAAVSCTGEYSAFHGGEKVKVLAAIVTTMNRVNQVYERDFAIRMNLVDREDTLIYINAATDPYSNDNSDKLINESHNNITKLIGTANFDIGHTFSTGAGGLAGLGVVCTASEKGSGITGIDSPIGDPYDIDYVAHEIGHEFGGDHTFNSSTGSCSGNRSANWAYEPASGITIMAYAGICAPQDLSPHSIDNFHVGSLEQILLFSRKNAGSKCPVKDTIPNTTPTVTYGTKGFTIPISTPFIMKGKATDAEGDTIHYCWEQYDLGPQGDIKASDTKAPLFRPFSPTLDSFRIFPRMSDIVNNKTTYGEVLPSAARTLNFRLTARDYRDGAHGGGGSSWENYQIKVAGTTPFLVTQPNKVDSFVIGSYLEVKWDVAKTNLAPVNCQKVNVWLSTDGGYNYPILLKGDTPNDGQEFVLVPDTITNQARIKVEAADNIFFDISNKNFKIKKPTQPGISLATSPNEQAVCLPNVAKIKVLTTSLLGYSDSISLSVKGLPQGAVATFSKEKLLPSEESDITIDFGSNAQSSVTSINVIATANDSLKTTFTQTAKFNLYSNDFSDLSLIAPVDGATGINSIVANPKLTWKKSVNATTYNVQIANSPTFATGTILASANDLTVDNFTPTTNFAENKTFYWRVQPVNSCGVASYSDAASFHTVVLNCSDYKSDSLLAKWSSSAATTINAPIDVAIDGTVNSVSIKFMRGKHNWFGDLQAYLVSPEDTVVTLFEKQCIGVGTAFNLGFDDLATPTNICPPNTGKLYKPKQALSKFKGVSTKGTWNLRMTDSNTSNGGTFYNWAIKFCADVKFAAPFLLENKELHVQPNKARYLKNYLMMGDTTVASNEVTYTIVTDTRAGHLLLNKKILSIGETFTQDDINQRKVKYENTDSTAVSDYFRFTATNPAGGYLGTPRFNIVIDKNATIDAAKDVSANNWNIRLYPNPAQDMLYLDADQLPTNTALNLRLVNAQGQMVRQWSKFSLQSTNSLELGTLPSGMYFLQGVGEKINFSKKVIIEK